MSIDANAMRNLETMLSSGEWLDTQMTRMDAIYMKNVLMSRWKPDESGRSIDTAVLVLRKTCREIAEDPVLHLFSGYLWQMMSAHDQFPELEVSDYREIAKRKFVDLICRGDDQTYLDKALWSCVITKMMTDFSGGVENDGEFKWVCDVFSKRARQGCLEELRLRRAYEDE